MRNWKDYITEAEEVLSEHELVEKLYRKPYIDHKQKKYKWISDRPGYKVVYNKDDMLTEVKITPKEERDRRRGANLGKLRHNKQREQKLRQGSFKKRASINLDYDKKHPELNTRREDGETLKSDKKGWIKQKLETLKNKLMKDIVKKK